MRGGKWNIILGREGPKGEGANRILGGLNGRGDEVKRKERN